MNSLLLIILLPFILISNVVENSLEKINHLLYPPPQLDPTIQAEISSIISKSFSFNIAKQKLAYYTSEFEDVKTKKIRLGITLNVPKKLTAQETLQIEKSICKKYATKYFEIVDVYPSDNPGFNCSIYGP